MLELHFQCKQQFGQFVRDPVAVVKPGKVQGELTGARGEMPSSAFSAMLTFSI
jgi:hypothetical protein